MEDGTWALGDLPAGVGAGTLFKYVVLKGKNPPKWETRPNRNWREVEAPVVTHIWDSTQCLFGSFMIFLDLFGHRLRNEKPKKAPALKRKLSSAPQELDGFVRRLAQEDAERVSYRLKPLCGVRV